MTCGKREGKRLSFRQKAKQDWIGRILAEEFCRAVAGCETQFGAETEKWESLVSTLAELSSGAEGREGQALGFSCLCAVSVGSGGVCGTVCLWG